MFVIFRGREINLLNFFFLETRLRGLLFRSDICIKSPTWIFRASDSHKTYSFNSFLINGI